MARPQLSLIQNLPVARRAKPSLKRSPKKRRSIFAFQKIVELLILRCGNELTEGLTPDQDGIIGRNIRAIRQRDVEPFE